MNAYSFDNLPIFAFIWFIFIGQWTLSISSLKKVFITLNGAINMNMLIDETDQKPKHTVETSRNRVSNTAFIHL